MATKRLPLPEFVALMAMLFATIAFSINGMLPALPDMAKALTPDAPNRVQLVVTSFVLGMGVGTLIAGPLSDAYGRRSVILIGALIYTAAAAVAFAAQSLEVLLIARVFQGLGAAAPRTVATAIVRDLYAGRGMARILSFIMLIFTLVPAVAPLVGTLIISVGDWRSIFLAFIIFAVVAMIWLLVRQPESLPADKRRPFRLPILWAGLREVVGHRPVMLTTVVLTLVFAMLFSVLQSIQPIFDVTFGRAESFPLWFCLIALISGAASLLNARIVMRLGMQRVVTGALASQVVISAVVALLVRAGAIPAALSFGVFLLWITSIYVMLAFTLGNLNAMALEPMGHLAGTATSIISSAATILSVLLAVPLALLFDGTIVPLATGIAAYSAAAWLYVRQLSELMENAEPQEDFGP